MKAAAQFAPNQTLLILRGSCPSKKDGLRPRARGSKGKGYHYDGSVTEQIKALETQARIQWGPRPAVDSDVRMEFRFFVTARRKDRDALYTTTLDLLVKARVLHNDNPVWCNGYHGQHPVVVVDHPRDERVEILIEEV